MTTILASLVSFSFWLAQAQPADASPKQLWVGYVIAGILGLCTLGVSFKNSKRTHQD